MIGVVEVDGQVLLADIFGKNVLNVVFVWVSRQEFAEMLKTPVHYYPYHKQLVNADVVEKEQDLNQVTAADKKIAHKL